MGHLINPIAFRLGFQRNWEFLFYTKNIYYPEYLHTFLNLRNYIYYYLTKKNFIKKGLLLSHIYLYKYQKSIIINIYLYHTDLEKKSHSLFNKVYEIYYKCLSTKSFKLPWNYFSIHNSDAFVYIFLFYQLFFKTCFFNEKHRVSKKFRYFNFNSAYYSNKLLELYNTRLLDKLTNISDSPLDEDIKNSYFLKKIKLNNNTWKKFWGDMLGKYKVKLDRLIKMPEYKYLKRQGRVIPVDKYLSISASILNTSFFFFFLYLCKKVNFKKYKNSINFNYKWSLLADLLSLYKYILYQHNKNDKYPYFFLFLNLAISLSDDLQRQSNPFYIRNVLYTFTYILFGKLYFFPFFEILSCYWKRLFYYISPHSLINLNYFFLSNLDINARFLSRYIGLKLQKGHYIFRIINPLKYELRRLYRLSDKKKKGHIYKYNSHVNYWKNQYIDLFYNLKDFFFYFLYVYYKQWKSIILYDLLEFQLYLRSIATLYKRNWKWTTKEINDFKFFYLEQYIDLIQFYKYIIILNNSHSSLLNSNNIIQYLQWSFYYLTFFKQPIYNNNIKFHIVPANLLYLSTMFSQYYLNYFYYKYLWLRVISMKKRLLRKQIISDYDIGLMGYKMAFKGRFSRKQRSRSIWLSHGRVPLNTISNKIDYAFFTIPLRNSAVSIKIWLYKNIECSSYKYILKY